jgi:hypothetical protein
MTDHSMTPTDEQLAAISDGRTFRDALRKAYTDGADAELEACCRSLDSGEHAASYGCHDGNSLREARRPKPPSLKQQALESLTRIEENKATYLDTSMVRKALMALSDE